MSHPLSPTGFDMPSRHEIICINKSDPTDPHERIVSIGGRNSDGIAWKLSQPEAIQGIETGKWEFFVRRGGTTANVVVAVSRYGNRYLKTQADGEQPDNLLSLPECS